MSKIIISTKAAPAAIGAYSQAVKVADTVYISGQIPLNPDTMEVISQDFEPQARQVFENLKVVADAAGGSLADAVKLTVYLTDLNDFAALNTVMADYISEPFPARAAVQVAALPKGVQIEIDAVLYLA
ncbi:MAG: reactive intermediate/imine deaminase [Dinoroseobacter sp.]|jgi:reactive intermediate/imine deaminase